MLTSSLPQRSLQVIYKSGDLLLHLLNDLLTFSKNQIGQQLSLEEKEFRLADVKSQITTIFDKQVREGHINFGVKFVGSGVDMESEMVNEKALPALGPQGIGRLKDMCLWGDQHRILQVIINLVSNSLKFTPEGGKVEVRIKCLGEAEPTSDGSRNSMGSKQSSQRTSRHRHRNGSGSSNGPKQQGTALLINPMDPRATPRVQVRERSPTPPPANARTMIFQFEVEDTGPGIPEHLQDRVFEPFVQGDLGLSKKYGGTGLGLSICSQLAGLMGGDISLISTEGVGTTFTMQIPLKHTRNRAPSTSSSDAYGSRPASEYNLSAPDEPSGGKSIARDTKPSGVAMPGSNSIGFQKDPQPRLVGLSQPFFAATPSPSTVKDSSEQLAALESVAGHDSETKLRVLVAEDNLVNQEVVLR
jgi:osomolarity two-component system sensor histidine kinase SLN1